MKLNEEIAKIKKMIMELSPKSLDVQEFLDLVKDNPALMNYLQFNNYERFQEYVVESDYDEYHELKSEAASFFREREENIESEIDELERASQDLSRDNEIDVSVDELKNIFLKAQEIELNKKILFNLENTECNQIHKGEMNKVIDLAKKYNKTNPLALKQSFKEKNYKKPLILKVGDRYILVAGNTRLCTAQALGIKPKVLVGTLM